MKSLPQIQKGNEALPRLVVSFQRFNLRRNCPKCSSPNEWQIKRLRQSVVCRDCGARVEIEVIGTE